MSDDDGACGGELVGNEKQRTDEERGKIIKDAVFGYIEVLPICVKIINTPEFQRLRRIQQLGVASHVFPTANNTRFQHCLGVYHVAKQWVEKLKKQKNDLITDKDVECVCIAALCFDLGKYLFVTGHGPFSHVWEHFMKRTEEKQWTADVTSIEMFDRIWKRDPSLKATFVKDDVEFIRKLMKGVDDPYAEEWLVQDRTRDKTFLYEIVINKRNGIDADKFAYITRDSVCLDIKTSVDYERLIQTSQIVSDEGINKLCFKHSEELNVYQVFLSRWNLYRQAYRHRTVRLIEYMLLDAFEFANEIHVTINGNIVKLSATINYLDTFIRMVDDSLFQRILDLPENHRARKLIERIESRDLYTQVGEKLMPAKEFTFEDTKKAIFEAVQDNIRAHCKEVGKDENEFDSLSSDFDIEIDRFELKRQAEDPVMPTKKRKAGDPVIPIKKRKAEDPMKSINYYKYEGNSNTAKVVPLEERPPASNFLTKKFEEVRVLLIWKPSKPVDNVLVGVVEKAFEKWVLTANVNDEKISSLVSNIRRATRCLPQQYCAQNGVKF